MRPIPITLKNITSWKQTRNFQQCGEDERINIHLPWEMIVQTGYFTALCSKDSPNHKWCAGSLLSQWSWVLYNYIRSLQKSLWVSSDLLPRSLESPAVKAEYQAPLPGGSGLNTQQIQPNKLRDLKKLNLQHPIFEQLELFKEKIYKIFPGWKKATSLLWKNSVFHQKWEKIFGL